MGNTPLITGLDLFNCREVGEEEEAFWIPGDWGNLRNLDHNAADPMQQNRDGENMIYLGGCMETDISTFKAHALFWGHGMDKEVLNIMTLDEMIQGISHWGRIEIAKIRRDINHTPFSN